MGKYNRSDISIYVNDAGWMIIAQGNPAQAKVDKPNYPMPLDDEEHGLYFSQLAHRVAWIDTKGRGHIGTRTAATAANKAGLVHDAENFGNHRVSTGDPLFIHKLSTP